MGRGDILRGLSPHREDADLQGGCLSIFWISFFTDRIVSVSSASTIILSFLSPHFALNLEKRGEMRI
jgi:hypothetical protein